MSKSWFLPPDFTFLPDGEIALGRVIPDPRRPTATLASLTDLSNLTLPEVKSIVEKNRSFSAEQSRSFGFELFATFIEFVSGKASTNVSWYKNKSLSAVDHEVRRYNGPFTPEALKAVVALDAVKKHIDSGRFGKRHVYLITGLRVAAQSFTVTDEKGEKLVGSLGGSGPVPAGLVPVELGGEVHGDREGKEKVSYETAPGIVFAYQLHVICPKGSGEEGELFSDRTAFFSGEAEVEEEEMEVVAVDDVVFRQDLDLPLNGCDNKKWIEEGDDESYVVFRSDAARER